MDQEPRKGPGRRKEDMGNCDEHKKNTEAIERLELAHAAQQSSSRTWRIVATFAIALFGIFLSFMAWVAQDYLKTVRDDVKEVKATLAVSRENGATTTAEMKNMERRLADVETIIREHILNKGIKMP